MIDLGVLPAFRQLLRHSQDVSCQFSHLLNVVAGLAAISEGTLNQIQALIDTESLLAELLPRLTGMIDYPFSP